MTKEKDISKMETTTLTKKWKNGTLKTGYYYFKTKNNIKNGFLYKGFNYPYDEKYNIINDVVEVLAEVPTYDHFVDLTEKDNQFSQLVKKVEKLEKQLDIATKVLGEYANKENWSNGFEEAQKALKEIDEVLR